MKKEFKADCMVCGNLLDLQGVLEVPRNREVAHRMLLEEVWGYKELQLQLQCETPGNLTISHSFIFFFFEN